MPYGIGPLEIVIVLLIPAQIAALVVTGMKGRWVWFVLGIIFWMPAFISAFLPARVDSTWALRRARHASWRPVG